MGKRDKKMDCEQVKDVILYNRPISQGNKKRYNKEDFVQLQENMRMMHNLVQFGSDVRAGTQPVGTAINSVDLSKRNVGKPPMTA